MASVHGGNSGAIRCICVISVERAVNRRHKMRIGSISRASRLSFFGGILQLGAVNAVTTATKGVFRATSVTFYNS